MPPNPAREKARKAAEAILSQEIDKLYSDVDAGPGDGSDTFKDNDSDPVMSENYSENPKGSRVNAPKASYQTPTMDQNFSGDRYDYETPPPVDQSTLPKSVMGRPVTEEGTWNVPRVSPPVPPVARFGPDAPQGQVVTVNDPNPPAPFAGPDTAPDESTGVPNRGGTGTPGGGGATGQSSSGGSSSPGNTSEYSPSRVTPEDEKRIEDQARRERDEAIAAEEQEARQHHTIQTSRPVVKMGPVGLVKNAEQRELAPQLGSDFEQKEERIDPEVVPDDQVKEGFAQSELDDMGAKEDPATGKASVNYGALVKRLGGERAKTLAAGSIPDRGGNVLVDSRTLKTDLSNRVWVGLMSDPKYQYTDKNGYTYFVRDGVLYHKWIEQISAQQRETNSYKQARDLTQKALNEDNQLELHEGIQRQVFRDTESTYNQDRLRILEAAALELEARKNDINRAVNDFNNAPPLDRERWWKKKNTGQKILSTIGAFFMGMIGGGAGIVAVTTAIDNDIKEQEEEYNRKKEKISAANNLYGSVKQYWDDKKTVSDVASIIALEDLKKDNENAMWRAQGNKRLYERLYAFNVQLEQAITDRKIAVAKETQTRVKQNFALGSLPPGKVDASGDYPSGASDLASGRAGASPSPSSSSTPGGGSGPGPQRGGGTGGSGGGATGNGNPTRAGGGPLVVTKEEAEKIINALPEEERAAARIRYLRTGELPDVENNRGSTTYRPYIGRVGVADSKDAAEKGLAIKNLADQVSQFATLWDQVVTSGSGAIPFNGFEGKAAALRSLASQIRLAYNQAIGKGGSVDNGLLAQLDDIITSLSGRLHSVWQWATGRGKSQIAQLIQRINDVAANTANTYSRDPDAAVITKSSNGGYTVKSSKQIKREEELRREQEEKSKGK